MYKKLQEYEIVALCTEKRLDIINEVQQKYGIYLNECSLCDKNIKAFCLKSYKEYLGTINEIEDVPNIIETVLSFIN